MASLVRGEIADRERMWTIGELARECDVTLRAMRFYEAKGLLKPARDGMARLYDAENRRRLQIILRAKKIGFSLVQIRDLLGLTTSREPLEHRLTSLRDHLIRQTEQLEHLRREAEEALTAIGDEIGALDRSLAGPALD
ncbi:MerR family transcriptional regulator [Pinisolibacter aquiterrae]|uniref:MerR family transcriptional regulator n=1 Tax=Pinisolibacter aquiterrae TaxID=2815579 RepID=UPI001E32010C|nr:MerR family transcriptional regulator [Pinisolibacter aquiterrae]MCC8234911.1 MerR family transcriptional regulator [Pinisolibacter aquiterrae]